MLVNIHVFHKFVLFQKQKHQQLPVQSNMRGIEMKETDSRTSAFTKTCWKSKSDLNNHNYGTYLQELIS